MDFNHPLAGKELLYHMKIVRVIKETKEKVRALLRYYNLNYETKLKEGDLKIESEKQIPEFIQKILRDNITKWIPEIKKLSFVSGGKNEKTKTGKVKEGAKKQEKSGEIKDKPNV